MNNEQIIQLLQRRRHDDLNEMQLLKAYFEMEKYDKFKKKLTEMVETVFLEQKLFNLHAPQFSLLITQYNYKYRNSNVTYNIHIDQADLSHVDHDLYLIGNSIAKYVNRLSSDSTLYKLNILIDREKCTKTVRVSFKINEMTVIHMNDLKCLFNKYNSHLDVTIESTEEGIIIQIHIPKSK